MIDEKLHVVWIVNITTSSIDTVIVGCKFSSTGALYADAVFVFK